MHTELGGHGNSAAEEKEGVQDIQHQGQCWMAGKVLLECDEYEVDEGQHGKDGDKHVVVDDGRVAREGGCNDVADEGHDEERPEELRMISEVLDLA